MKDLLQQSTRGLLIQPRFSSNSFWNYTEVCEFAGAKYPAAPLGLMTVAALLPQHWQFKLVDENVRPLTDADLEWADVVLTGGMLPQQKETLAIIDKAHGKGKPVVVGGPDPTSQPQVYERADFLVLGEGEVSIPLFLEDLGKGVTTGEYRSPVHADMEKAAVPRFDLIRFQDYLHVGIQFSRGCPYNCEFCDIIELFGRQPRTKTVDQILAELQRLYDLGHRGHVDFVDDNFIGNKTKVVEVLEAVAEWSKHQHYPFHFSTEASINLVKEKELLWLMQENDFRYVFVGFESPDEEVLRKAHKLQNTAVSAVEAVKTLAAHGIIVNGGFILGFDNETEGTAQRMIDLIQEAGICMAMVGTLFALPNTQLDRRLKREGRLFSGGRMVVEQSQQVDQTTSGLNFATIRPRTAIMQDHAEVLRQIYHPQKYYARVLSTAAQLRPAGKNRPGLRQALRLVWGFLKVCAKAGTSPQSGLLYWKTLFSVLLTNPKALEATVNLAAMYVHFSKQTGYVIDTLNHNTKQVEYLGEEKYNEQMLSYRPAG